MPSDKDIEGYARECVRLAQLTTDPQVRERLFQMDGAGIKHRASLEKWIVDLGTI